MTKRRTLPDLSDFDIRLLRVFAAVAEARGYSAAEILLNKSKSSISIDMSALETRLGMKLCRRGREGFALTPEGEEILSLSRELFHSLENFREKARKMTSVVEGELVIILDDNFPLAKQTELTRMIREFHLSYPQVFLTLRTTSPEQVIKSVLEGSADIGVTAAPLEVAGATVDPLFEETMVLCCADTHALFSAARAPIDKGLLKSCDFVDIVTRQNILAKKVFETFKVKGRGPTLQSRLLMILSGQYIGYLPDDLIEPYVARQRIRKINEQSMSYKNVCSIFVRDEIAPSNAQVSAVSLLKKCFTPPAAKERVALVAPPIIAARSRDEQLYVL